MKAFPLFLCEVKLRFLQVFYDRIAERSVCPNNNANNKVEYNPDSQPRWRTSLLPVIRAFFLPVESPVDVWVETFTMQVHAHLEKHGQDVSLRDLRLYKVTIFFLWQTVN